MAETIYAILENGVAANTIVADAAFIAAYYPEAVRIDGLSPRPGIGWSYSGSAFTSGPIQAVLTFGGTSLVLPQGATLTSLKSADGVTAYTPGTDYTVSGTAVSQVSGGALASGQAVLATYVLTAA